MEKAIPSEKQLRFLDWELGAFFHFGLRAYYKGYVDWDKRDMDQSVFNPTELNCEEWLQPFKDAGASYAILVCKHHDGFANWPSKYSDYSVAHTPWKEGKGDIVREFTDACRKLGLKVGLYYSPAQRDWSKYKTKRDYDDYFIGQVSELLTDYGKIDYLWFDGCGSEDHEYDQARIINVMRSLQPDMLIFNMWDPDVRWVGNEEGIAPSPHTNVVHDLAFSVMTDKKDDLGGFRFMPAECDMKLRSTWFDCEDNEDTLVSLDELIGLYYMSVGRGANLLINAGPNKHGLLQEADKKRIQEFGAELKRRFSTPVPFGAPYEDEDGNYTISADCGLPVNTVIIQEDLLEGESIRHFEILTDNTAVYTGSTIGHKCICTFPTVKTKNIRIRVTDTNGAYTLKSLNAYYIQ